MSYTDSVQWTFYLFYNNFRNRSPSLHKSRNFESEFKRIKTESYGQLKLSYTNIIQVY